MKLFPNLEGAIASRGIKKKVIADGVTAAGVFYDMDAAFDAAFEEELATKRALARMHEEADREVNAFGLALYDDVWPRARCLSF